MAQIRGKRVKGTANRQLPIVRKDMLWLIEHKLVIAAFFLLSKCPDEAAQCCWEVLEHLKETPHARAHAMCSLTLGQAQYFRGQSDDARFWLVQAVKLGRKLARTADQPAELRSCQQAVAQASLFLAKLSHEHRVNIPHAHRLLNCAETGFHRAQFPLGVALVRQAREEMNVTPSAPIFEC